MLNLIPSRRFLALSALCGTLSVSAVSHAAPKMIVGTNAGANALTAGTSSMAPRLKGKPDTQMAAVLNSLVSLKGKPIEKLTPKEARLQPGPPDAVKKLLIKQNRSTAPEKVASIVDYQVPTPEGDVTVRVYKPLNAPAGPLPMVVYFHGGGFVIASVTAYDSSCRAMANASGAIVCAVGYSLAPEKRLPVAHEQSYAVTQFVMKNGAAWGGNPKKVAVLGESAGGNLATDMCIMAKMRGGMMPIHQVLVYPFVNNKVLPSHNAYAKAKPLSKPMVFWFLKYASPTDKATLKKIAPLATPLYAPDSLLKGLPAATIIAAELDPLQSEGQRYAKKLMKNGVPVTYRMYAGVTHEFFGMAAVADKAKSANQFAASELKKAFAK